MDAIIVVAKPLDRAKSRLSTFLPPAKLKELVRVMLADVLRACQTPSIRLLATPDAELAQLGAKHNFSHVQDAGIGINTAVDNATQAAASLGASCALVLPADVPLLSEHEVRSMLALPNGVGVTRSQSAGTNGLFRRPPLIIESHFGPDSAAAHEHAARTAGCNFFLMPVAGLSLDIDDASDLRQLALAQVDTPSARLARKLILDGAKTSNKTSTT